MNIYLAGPISGKTAEEVMANFAKRKVALEDAGYHVFNPMVGKGHLRTEINFRAHGYDHPLSNNHAIIERDRWMVTISDVVYFDLMDAERVSIGSMFELAWAHDHGIHTVVAMPKESPHTHAFVLEAADVLWHSRDEAMSYLVQLGKDVVGVNP